MAELKICRICLMTDTKFYNYDTYQLKSFYEEVLAMRICQDDGLPHYFCYECAFLLHKFHKFKEKCHVGQQTLKELHCKTKISYSSVNKINRKAKHVSPIQVSTVSNLVKTYVIKNTDNETESDDDDVEKPLHRIESVEIDTFNDDSHSTNGNDPTFEPADSKSDKEDLDDIPLQKFAELTKETVKIENDEHNFDEIQSLASPISVEEEKVKKEVRSRRNKQNKEKTYRFTRSKMHVISPECWKKSNLTEEEAIAEFKARLDSTKYKNAAFKCIHCIKGFSKKEMLDRHNLLRHSQNLGRQECRFCHMRFKWDCMLRKHMRQHYTKYQCLKCDLTCSLESTAILHEAAHNGVTKKCFHCGEEFRHSSTYYTHLRTHRSEHLCTLCGASFVSEMGLHQHKRVKHVTNEIESPDDDEDLNTFCEKCDIRFETRKAYEEHLFHSDRHTEGVEDEVNELVPPRKVLSRRYKDKIAKDLRGCKDTSNVVYPPATKRRKRNKRAFKKPTTCHQCGKHFDTQAACLKHHLKEHPRTSFCPPTQRHICEICGASLAPGSVAVHHNMHTKEKMHHCDTCGRSFHASMSLKRHILTHTGEKPFPCTLCDKRFTQSNSMKLHYNTFHLKQPYPKRNRRKKKDDGLELSLSDMRNDSDSLPETDVDAIRTKRHSASISERLPDDNMHYLTLS